MDKILSYWRAAQLVDTPFSEGMEGWRDGGVACAVVGSGFAASLTGEERRALRARLPELRILDPVAFLRAVPVAVPRDG
jgi:hypothetical protein